MVSSLRDLFRLNQNCHLQSLDLLSVKLGRDDQWSHGEEAGQRELGQDDIRYHQPGSQDLGLMHLSLRRWYQMSWDPMCFRLKGN